MSVIDFCRKETKQASLGSFYALLILLVTPLSGWFGSASGGLYAQCSTSTPTVLAKWDFNSLTTQCNGAVAKGTGTITAPFLLQGQNTYCPNTNNGCGTALLGTKGFGNTNDFKNAICLAGFWRNDGGIYSAAPGWNVNDVVFHPEIPANLSVSYSLPAGKAGNLSSFSLKILQKQFDGINPSFEKQGVGVYRNGVLIYSQTQAIAASNVNGSTALTFTFPSTPEFISDGSAAITFEIVFGLVHRLLKISTGYDDICIIGSCGGSPSPTAAISPATCSTGTTNNDGKITLSNFGATDHYDISTGSSYTGVQTYATATVIPAGGVITSTLPNPATPQVYTVRVFTSAGCTTDLPVTLDPTACPGNCTVPTATVTGTAATCTGTSVNNNASIVITGVTGGDKVGISPGTFYAGPIYTSAKSLTAGAYTFSALPNPTGSQTYTVRVFNADDNCFNNYPITLTETSCGCKKIGVQVTESDQADPDSSPNNNATTEDDYASYEVCEGTQTIDLKLVKTVSPNSGSTCPTNTDFVWKMVLTNAGSLSATNIQVADKMPVDLLITSATVTSGTFTISGGWLVPSLAAGESTTLTVTTKATKPGTYINCAWVSNAFPLNDPNSSPLNDYTANEDDDDCASITITGSKTPEVAKEFSPNSARTNTPIRLTIKLTNNEATPVTLTAPMVDNLPASPAQMTVASIPNLTTSLPGVLATGGGTTITVPTGTVLAPGLNLIQVDVLAPADGEYCNDILAGALQTTVCANVAATQACVIVKSTYVMGPQITKAFIPQIVGVGQSSTLVITVQNSNPTSITALQDFIDQLPTGLIVSGDITGTCPGLSLFASTNQVGLAIGSVIAPGTCTIRVPVQSAAAGAYCNTIPQNALIGSISNGSLNVMTGNDDIATACLDVTPNPCSTLDITSLTPVSLTVAPSGTVSLTLNGTGFSASTLYTWTGTGAFDLQGVSTSYTAPATTGTYTLTVAADNRLTGYGACADNMTVNVLVQAPVVCSLTATATASSQTVCQNQSVTLSTQVSPTGSYTYVWAAPAGITLTGANTATATASMSVSGLQTFTVVVTSSPSCSTTATVSVLVSSPTTLPVYQPTTLCEGGSLNFSISPPAGASAYWTTPSNTTINSGTVAIGSALISDGGMYTLYYTNANGCTSSSTKSVTINPKPTLSLLSSDCISGSQSYTVSLSTNASSLTTNASQLGVTISGSLVIIPVTVTSFAVSASSAAGCIATLPITVPACVTACSLTAVSTAGICATATNTYSATTVVTMVNPTAGLLTVTNGVSSVTFAVPASLGTINAVATFSGLISDGVSHTITASLPGCSTTITTYTAPVSCSVAPICSLTAEATASTCATATNTYSATVAVALINGSAGTITVSLPGSAPVSQTLAANTGSFNAVFTGLPSDGAVHTATISLPGCGTTNAEFTAPVSCLIAPMCSISAVATAGLCQSATNTFTSVAVINLTNPVTGILTVSDGPLSLTFATTAGGSASFTATFGGIVSDGTSHLVLVSLPGCGTATTSYIAPVSCTVVNPLGSLGDFVWKDNNNNGIQDASEPGVAGITVELYTVVGAVTSSTPIATTITSSSGLYGFSNLPSGQYQVKFTIPASLTGTCQISAKPNTGVEDTVDSDVDPATGFSPVVTIDATQPTSSTARNNPTIDMGLHNRSTATITDPCQCFNVEWLVGEKRELFETFDVQSSPGESWSVISQTGMLALDTLVKHPVLIGTLLTETPVGSGKYQLSFTHEDNVGYTVKVSNGVDTLSIGNLCHKYPAYSTTVLSQTMCRTTKPVDLTATISIPGATEFYYIDKTTHLPVVITQFDPSQFAEGDTITVKLLITPTDITQCSFTVIQTVLISSVECTPLLGSIGDFVWNDQNKDGQQDSNEPGVGGVTVRLLQETTPGNYTVVSTTVTSGSGAYLFPNLPGGTYVVEFDKTTLPANFTLTTVNALGVTSSLDSDADPLTGRSGLIALVPTNPALRDRLTIDAGIVNTDCPPTVKCIPIAIKRIR